jgi:hypothetical protein
MALTPQEKMLRSIKERDWQATVIRVAVDYGWKYYHAPDNKPINGRIQKVVAGFPDLVLVKGRRLVFAELKRELGIVSPQQEAWLDALRQTGAEGYIWRPSDLDEVLRVLSNKQ